MKAIDNALMLLGNHIGHDDRAVISAYDALKNITDALKIADTALKTEICDGCYQGRVPPQGIEVDFCINCLIYPAREMISKAWRGYNEQG